MGPLGHSLMRQWGNEAMGQYKHLSCWLRHFPDWARKDKRSYCLIAQLPHCPINMFK